MIFILGGNGFIGSAFNRFCTANNIESRVITRSNYNDFVGKPCRVLINANGNSSKVFARENPLDDFNASVNSVKKSLLDFKADYYIYLSSCDVYPDCSSPASTQEDAPIEINKQSPYGFHKYLAEQCVRNFHKNWLILRLGGFVGRGLKKGPIFDILHSDKLWVNPESEFQFLNTDNLAKIVFSLINQGIHNQILNITARGKIKISQILNVLQKSIVFEPSTAKLQYDLNLENISKFTDLPSTPDEIADFIQSFLK